MFNNGNSLRNWLRSLFFQFGSGSQNFLLNNHNVDWLKKAEDNIERTINVDSTTVATSREKFVRVC